MKQLLQLCLLLCLLFNISELKEETENGTLQRLAIIVEKFPNLAQACWPEYKKNHRRRTEDVVQDETVLELIKRGHSVLKQWLELYYPILAQLCNEKAWDKYKEDILDIGKAFHN